MPFMLTAKLADPRRGRLYLGVSCHGFSFLCGDAKSHYVERGLCNRSSAKQHHIAIPKACVILRLHTGTSFQSIKAWTMHSGTGPNDPFTAGPI
eukprot:944350-Pelagomonas_calceolata.AAC.2